MSFSKHHFAPGDKIKAAPFNEMEDQIALNESMIGVLSQTAIVFVTPEMYGALGDGIHDDGPALQTALATEKPVYLMKDLHVFTNVQVIEKNVYLNGQGYTIYLHGENMTGNTAKGGTGGECIVIGTEGHQGVIENADVVVYTENDTSVMSPAFPQENSYRRGYLSYHGFNPTPDKEHYDNYTASSWMERRAIIQNCRFVGDHTDGLKYLRLDRLCHSVVDNCEFICTTEDGAAIGIMAQACYDVTISRIRAQNFTANTSRSIVYTGYAIQATGDAIIIRDCILKNCKNHVNIGGASGAGGFFTTGAIMENLVLQTTQTGAVTADGSGASLYQQMLDLHEGCHKPIINNVILEFENAMGADDYGTLIHLSCPEAVVSNVTCKFTKAYGNWALGYIGFGPLAKRMFFSNLHAPGCHLFAHGWGYERGRAYDGNYTREINIIGGEIGGIMSGTSQGLVTIRLSGVRVSGLVGCASLIAENCVFHNTDRTDNGPQITITNEAFFTNCDIYGYNLDSYKRSKPVIRAPANSVWMTGGIVRKPLDEILFDAEQTHIANTAVWDLYGLILGSRTTSEYTDGDACVLGSYNLW